MISPDRMKRRVRYEVARAIERGELTRLPCEVCGSETVHAHHEDYDKPLEVRWLCNSHHRLRHGELTREAREEPTWELFDAELEDTRHAERVRRQRAA